MAAKPNTEHKQPKVVALQTYVLSMALGIVLSVMAGTVAGWFVHVNMQGDARAAVYSDMQLVKNVTAQSK